MSDLHKAAQQALGALELAQTDVHWELNSPTRKFLRKAEKNLRAALTEPVEPVPQPGVWMHPWPPVKAQQAEPKGGGNLPPPLQTEPVEPVAWYQKRGQEVLTSHPACWGREDEPWTPLYTAPPQRLPLTEQEIDAATAQERDALLDHIYEYGTAAEGVLERIRKLCRAAAEIGRGSA